MKIGIVGLGLIGGSIAKSLKAKTSHTVYASDINEETMLLARMLGSYDAPLSDDNIGECDIVILALCPSTAVAWAQENAHKIAKSATLADICGVKRAVFDKLSTIAKENGFYYIGTHPMAGKERGKFQNATDDLFEGASMIIVPEESTPLDKVETFSALCLDMGFARNVFSDCESHDKIIAYTSQLPHIISNAYIKSPEAQLNRGFSAGSFKDLSRVALLDENMWTELFLSNADYLGEQLEIFANNLQKYADAIKAGDADTLRELLKEGRELKSTAGGN